MTVSTFCLYGKSKIKKTANENRNITVGFKTGQDLLFKSPRPMHPKANYSINKSLYLKKQVNQHIALEGGVNYNTFHLPYSQNRESAYNQPYQVSVPVTLQYYMLPKKSRLRPYCGAGFQYNAISQNYKIPQSDALQPSAQPGNKYISIVFTQGVTFEVNTKIEITQSFHFISNNSDKIIGIDLGIGYKLP